MQKIKKEFSLGNKLKKGILWQYIQTGFITVFNFIAGIILARLLVPSDFGVFAAVTAFTNLMVLQIRFSWPATLLRSDELVEPLLSTIFWIMQGTALFFVIIVLCIASFLGSFYDDSRFAMVMTIFSIQFFIIPFNAINGSILRWQMRYDLVSRITICVTIISTVSGIFFAYIGFGVYSFLISGLLSVTLLTIINAFYAPWKPCFVFSWMSAKPFVNFSWRLHVNNTLNLLSNRIDNMLIGKFVGVSLLGIYSKAFNLGRMPVQLLGANLYQIFYTALSHSRKKIDETILLFQKMLMVLTFATYLPLLLLFLIGEGLVTNLYGIKWVLVVLPMKIMIAGSFFRVISMACGALCDAHNLVGKETKIQLFNILFTVLAVIIGSKWGLEGVAIGISLKMFIIFVMMMLLVVSGVSLTWVMLLQPLWTNFLALLLGFFAGRGTIHFLGANYQPTSFEHMSIVAVITTVAYFFSWIVLSQFNPYKTAENDIFDFMKRPFLLIKSYLNLK